MLTIIYIEALLVDEKPADQVWRAIMVTKNFLSAGSIVFALSLLTSTTNDWGSYVALTVSDWSASITVFMRARLAAIGR